MKIDVAELMRQKSSLSTVQGEMTSLASNINGELDNVCNNVRSAELVSSLAALKDNVSSITQSLNNEIGRLTDFMETQLNAYKVTNEEAVQALTSLVQSINGTFDSTGSMRRSNAEIASEVIGGQWGTGDERKQKLTEAGYDPSAIQQEVNNQLSGGGSTSGSTTTGGGSTGGSPTTDGGSTGGSPTTDGGSTGGSVPTSGGTGSSGGTVNTSKYTSKPSQGFNVTTGNKTFSMSGSELDKLTAIVSAECDGTYDDALGVITTILNRCDDSWCVKTYGGSPLNQATAKGQFEVVSSGSYKKFLNGNSSSIVQEAVQDALNGVRNHNYMFFRSNGSTKYSSNMISPTGNRYGNH